MRVHTKAQRVATLALSGKRSHAATKEVFSGLDWKAARLKPRGIPHSVYELLWHMTYWQGWVVAWMAGKDPAPPRHASGSWPAEPGPMDRGDWQAAVKQFRKGLAALERACGSTDLASRRGRTSQLEMLHTIAAHNSYHAGQVAFLRQILGKWPPPSGGVTW